MEALDIEVTEDKLLFTNFAVFDNESICVKSSTIADTGTTTWVGNHTPFSVSLTSNLFEEPIFNCNTEPQSLMFSFVISVKNLAEKSKLELGPKFLTISKTIKEKLERVTSTLSKRRQTFSPTSDNDQESAVDTEDDEDEEKDSSLQFFSTQKTIYLNSNSILSVMSTLSSLWFQQWWVRFEIKQILLSSSTRRWKRTGTNSYQESEPICILQVWKRRVLWYDEIPCRCNLPRFFPENV